MSSFNGFPTFQDKVERIHCARRTKVRSRKIFISHLKFWSKRAGSYQKLPNQEAETS